ncbi:AraC family transcriptional regulator [Nitratireductor sp. XY-223]|uniref:AraC family transcriptional regulator n=1 Tax=Nitratireductor sp. XY-223 TaxID=2561926 RepID=UPI0010AA8392|nr:AraC family transcriptional regulator [Nitratireductor sp. XY-223]
MTTPTASSYLVAHLVATLKMLGIDATPALHSAGIDKVVLSDPDTRLPITTVFRFWCAVEDMTGDPLIGLKTAANVEAGYPVFRHLLSNSPTLSVAYERWSRFYRLISGAAEIRLVRDADTPMLVCEPATPHALPALGEDWTVGQWLTLGRRLTGRDWRPKALWLKHTDFGAAAAYRKWFAAPVTFGADSAAMALPAEILEFEIPGADATLLDVLDRHVGDMIAHMPAARSTASVLRGLLAKRLAEGRTTHAGVASELGMSERTLQRRLNLEGTTFRTVFTEVRRDIAEATLSDPDISLGETAFLLGFSEPSAFHRAFKRWTGQTPAAYRAKHSAVLLAGAVNDLTAPVNDRGD